MKRKRTMACTAAAITALGAGAAPAQAADGIFERDGLLGGIGELLERLLGGGSDMGGGIGDDGSGGSFAVNTQNDTTDANPGDGDCADAAGDCSLRAAVQEANALGGSSTITLRDTTYRLTLPGPAEDAAATGDLDVTSDIELDGNGATVDANGIDRAFDVLAGAGLAAERLAVLNGAPPSGESGGALRSAGTLGLDGVDVRDSDATGPMASGGAVFNNAGTLDVSGGRMQGNTAVRAGGAIEANAGSTKLDDVVLNANATGPTPGNGGGLHLTGAGTVEVSDSTVTGNTASAEGGGLWNSATGTMTVDDTRLTGNKAGGADATQGGGALFNEGANGSGGNLTVDRSVLRDNVADGAAGSGGGILNDQGTLTVSRTELRGNTAKRAGGGIEANLGTTKLDRAVLRANSTGAAPGNGGGLHLTGAGTVEVDRSEVIGNTATAEGGGLWNSAAGTMTVNRTQLTGNTAAGAGADQGGGALFNDGEGPAGGKLTVDRSVLRNNDATGTSGSGGGILNDEGTLIVRRSELRGNSAPRAGGGIEANIGTTTLDDVELLGNETGDNPGNGGGLHLTGAGTVTIDDSSVRNNSAANEGGGLWNSATGTMTVTGTDIRNNTAQTGPNVYQDPPGTGFTIDGEVVPPTT